MYICGLAKLSQRLSLHFLIWKIWALKCILLQSQTHYFGQIYFKHYYITKVTLSLFESVSACCSAIEMYHYIAWGIRVYLDICIWHVVCAVDLQYVCRSQCAVYMASVQYMWHVAACTVHMLQYICIMYICRVWSMCGVCVQCACSTY